MKEKTRTIIRHWKELYPDWDSSELEEMINSVSPRRNVEETLEDIYKLEVAGLKRK